MTKFLELTFSGISVGAQYALVALGLRRHLPRHGVINFAQGGFVLLGAYFTYNFHQTWGICPSTSRSSWRWPSGR